MEVKLLQLQKQLHPKLVTDSGMVMEVNLEQLWKESAPMLVTE